MNIKIYRNLLAHPNALDTWAVVEVGAGRRTIFVNDADHVSSRVVDFPSFVFLLKFYSFFRDSYDFSWMCTALKNPFENHTLYGLVLPNTDSMGLICLGEHGWHTYPDPFALARDVVDIFWRTAFSVTCEAEDMLLMPGSKVMVAKIPILTKLTGDYQCIQSQKI